MSLLRTLLSFVLALCLVNTSFAQRQDPRDQFNTRSLEAAKHMAQAVELAQAKKNKEALAAAEAALNADPQCQMAHYWKSIILADLGEIPESIAALKKSLSDDVNRSTLISANAAVNLGITLSKVEEYEEASRWFTRAILEDHNNAVRQRGKAYRNLGISLQHQGKPLAAALAIALAHEDGAANVDMKMVRHFFENAKGYEVARLLSFDEPTPKVTKRSHETKLMPLQMEDNVPDSVSSLLADPHGRYVVAVAHQKANYYVLTTEDKVKITRIEVKNPILCACLAEDFLYTVSDTPPRIEKWAVETGKLVESHSLKTHLPHSLAVLPARSVAYFPHEGVLHGLNLKTGNIFKTDIPGHVVAAHPYQQFVFSYLRPERRGGGATSGHILVNGKPIFFHINNAEFDWEQATLFKAVAVPEGLLLTEVRENIASNAWHMSLSPDGQWVTVVGGGGWRPTTKPEASGYGFAVFSAHNLERLHRFYAITPFTVAFNPASGQLALIRLTGNYTDAKVCHLADPTPAVELKGKFSTGTWSGNGRYLVLANEGSAGVTLYANSLSEAERNLGATWWKNLQVSTAKSTPRRSPSFEPVEALGQFTLKSPTREELALFLSHAAEKGRTDRPASWRDYAPYLKEEEVGKTLQAIRPLFDQKEDNGLVIFRLKKALKTHADSVPLKYFMAEALNRGNQTEEAEKLYLEVIRGDSGRTELSCLALNALAVLLAKEKPLSALDCLAASLTLDRGNADTLAQALTLLKQQKLDKEAEHLAKLAAGLAADPAIRSVELPKLAKPDATGKQHNAADIYKKAVPSVVLIETEKGSGSGVCVGQADIVLTNWHVVADGSAISVSPFILKDNTLTRLPKIRATVAYRSAREDLAVLKLEKAPEHLVPLAVAVSNPGAGDKVYALGSPGLGKELLEQSISEGIVSAKSRILEGTTYLQHTAAVNPGNSGGPLINDGCQLVGVVTLKARLENVSFAIPVESVRKLFKSE
jgi:S1-C subfamily serine protease/Tfp pilus assembly protein PilF